MKEQIINVALKQMKLGGYGNLNFADIAVELKVSRANLHHHFKNKFGLGLATTKAYIEREKLLVESILREHDGDLKAILFALEELLIDELCSSQDSGGCIMCQLIHEVEAPEEIRQLAVSRYSDEEESIMFQARTAKKNGFLADDTDEHSLAFRIMATMSGISHLALAKPDKKQLKKNIRGCLSSLIF